MKDYYSDISQLVKVRSDENKRDYIALLNAGVAAREEKLRENEHKPGFDNIDIDWAFARLKQEVVELDKEINGAVKRDYHDIRLEAADIGNFADMIILKCSQEINNV